MWTLFVLVIGFHNSAVAVTSLPGFESQLACQRAAQAVYALDKVYDDNRVFVTCLNKAN